METAEAIKISSHQKNIQHVQQYLNQRILGQETLMSRLLIALLADGHLLVEGAPGLAKTKAIKELAQTIESRFHRIQFTPDLLPADLTGTDIYRPESGEFTFQPGPVFNNLLLADEINRAPAKVQSALLEAMAERQVTIGQKTYRLPKLFLVMATQNPIEQEGTYSLPEAQLDRFLMYVRVDYPHSNVEKDILKIAREEARQELQNQIKTNHLLNEKTILDMRREILDIHLSPAIEHYIIALVTATRHPDVYDKQLKRWLRYGASPRATIAFDRCARAHAWLKQRDYVSPEDVQALAHDILRHRIILSFEAEAEGIDADKMIDECINRVPVP